MLLPYRNGSSDTYRYGFNGKENDNEVKGRGLQVDYGFRIYDPRVGKFLSTDPLFKGFPYYTPYQFAGNKPIWAIDLDGLEEYHYVFTLDENGDCKIELETVNDIIEKTWNWKTFSFDTEVNEYEKHIVHYRPEILVVVEFQGVMSKQDYTETYDNKADALNTTYDDFEDDFVKGEILQGIANGAAFRGNTRNMRRTPRSRNLDSKAQPKSHLLKFVRGMKNFSRISHEIKSKSFFGQSVMFNAKMAVSKTTMLIKDIYMFRKGSLTWSDKGLVGKMGREVVLFKSEMIQKAKEKGVKTLVLEFMRTGEGSTKRERAMIMEIDVETGKTIRTEEISISQHNKNNKKD